MFSFDKSKLKVDNPGNGQTEHEYTEIVEVIEQKTFNDTVIINTAQAECETTYFLQELTEDNSLKSDLKKGLPDPIAETDNDEELSKRCQYIPVELRTSAIELSKIGDLLKANEQLIFEMKKKIESLEEDKKKLKLENSELEERLKRLSDERLEISDTRSKISDKIAESKASIVHELKGCKEYINEILELYKNNNETVENLIKKDNKAVEKLIGLWTRLSQAQDEYLRTTAAEIEYILLYEYGAKIIAPSPGEEFDSTAHRSFPPSAKGDIITKCICPGWDYNNYVERATVETEKGN